MRYFPTVPSWHKQNDRKNAVKKANEKYTH